MSKKARGCCIVMRYISQGGSAADLRYHEAVLSELAIVHMTCEYMSKEEMWEKVYAESDIS